MINFIEKKEIDLKCCLNIFPHIYKYDNYNYIIYSIIIMELMKVYIWLISSGKKAIDL